MSLPYCRHNEKDKLSESTCGWKQLSNKRKLSSVNCQSDTMSTCHQTTSRETFATMADRCPSRRQENTVVRKQCTVHQDTVVEHCQQKKRKEKKKKKKESQKEMGHEVMNNISTRAPKVTCATNMVSRNSTCAQAPMQEGVVSMKLRSESGRRTLCPVEAFNPNSSIFSRIEFIGSESWDTQPWFFFSQNRFRSSGSSPASAGFRGAPRSEHLSTRSRLFAESLSTGPSASHSTFSVSTITMRSSWEPQLLPALT